MNIKEQEMINEIARMQAKLEAWQNQMALERAEEERREIEAREAAKAEYDQGMDLIFMPLKAVREKQAAGQHLTKQEISLLAWASQQYEHVSRVLKQQQNNNGEDA